MSYCVTKLAEGPVVPLEPTPTGNLPLSSIDLTPGLRDVMVDSIHVFGHGVEPAKVIRDALSKALVPYYPVAGRFVKHDDGEMEVACTGEGAWFVEAIADFRLEDVNNLERPLMVPKEEFLPTHPPHQKGLLFMMQVTQFRCGGFSVGIVSSHAMSDGIGAAQFVNAVAEMARGLPAPTVEPIWCRDAIPKFNPAKKLPPPGPPPTLTVFDFRYSISDISLDTINEIKNRFTRETGERCSTFDVITAMVWRARTRAIGLESDVDVNLGFAADTRHLLRDLLPKEKGYYGNCVYPMSVTASSGKIAGSSLVEIVGLVREAKKMLPTKFAKFMAGENEEDPYKVPFDYGTFIVADWNRVGFYEVDYGWGEPAHIVPFNDSRFIGSCIVLRTPKPIQGVRLMMLCVVEEHWAAFNDQIMNLA